MSNKNLFHLLEFGLIRDPAPEELVNVFGVEFDAEECNGIHNPTLNSPLGLFNMLTIFYVIATFVFILELFISKIPRYIVERIIIRRTRQAKRVADL